MGTPSIPESMSGSDILGVPIMSANKITTVIMAVPVIHAKIDFKIFEFISFIF
jgi:hypothetical protein